MSNPYVVAGYAIFWRFPTAVEREAYIVPSEAEVDRFAHQVDNNTTWLLTQASPAVWAQVGGTDPDVADNDYSGDPTLTYVLAKA